MSNIHTRACTNAYINLYNNLSDYYNIVLYNNNISNNRTHGSCDIIARRFLGTTAVIIIIFGHVIYT